MSATSCGPVAETPMSGKSAILAWNGVLVAGGIAVALFVALGTFAPIVKSGVVWYCIPLALLILAEWLLYRERYRAAAILMFVGGLGTVPIGLLAIIGSLVAYRMRLQVRAQDELAVPCAQCGYDLRGGVVPRCPECGCVVGFQKTAQELGIGEDELWDAFGKDSRPGGSESSRQRRSG